MEVRMFARLEVIHCLLAATFGDTRADEARDTRLQIRIRGDVSRSAIIRRAEAAFVSAARQLPC